MSEKPLHFLLMSVDWRGNTDTSYAECLRFDMTAGSTIEPQPSRSEVPILTIGYRDLPQAKQAPYLLVTPTFPSKVSSLTIGYPNLPAAKRAP